MGCPKLTYHQETELRIIHRRKELTINKSDLKGGNNLVFGMLMPGRQYNSGEYAFGYQGSLKDNEVAGQGNSYSTFYRQLDPRLARWKSLDPVFQPHQSPYTSMDNNPIWFIDPMGDSIVVNKVGEVIHNDEVDLRVFSLIDEELKEIGELGKEVDVSEVYENLLKEHGKEAEEMNIFEWANNVKYEGDWDLKNTYDNPNNPDDNDDVTTIYGLAWKNHKKIGNTKFKYNELTFPRAADVGNHHAGFTGTKADIRQDIQLIGAGVIEQLKKRQYWNLLPSLGISIPSENLKFNPVIGGVFNGDHPVDWLWNTQGMRDAKKR